MLCTSHTHILQCQLHNCTTALYVCMYSARWRLASYSALHALYKMLTSDNECHSVAGRGSILEEALEGRTIVGGLGFNKGQVVICFANIHQVIVVVVEGQTVSKRATAVVGPIDPEVWFLVWDVSSCVAALDGHFCPFCDNWAPNNWYLNCVRLVGTSCIASKYTYTPKMIRLIIVVQLMHTQKLYTQTHTRTHSWS